jgi:alanyl-tRNA synthetase
MSSTKISGGNKIRQSYLNYFKKKDHHLIPSASLIPQNDPTTLFTGSGMQPLINYFLGETHPLGRRIVDSQKCFRAEDIEEVGDNRHTTFFEMLGNWSFGDYFKAEQLPWIHTFFTQNIGLNPDNLVVTVFEGSKNAPKDSEAIKLWQEIFATKSQPRSGMSGYSPEVKIYEYGEAKNWWSRSGKPNDMPPGEPGGTTSEIFYLFESVQHNPSYGEVCHPNCDCGRFLEIGNSVFMEYKKEPDGSFSKLPSKNIDFGGGLERIAAAAGNNPDVFTTDLFMPLIQHLEKASGQEYVGEDQYPMRLIVDHLRGAAMMMAEGIEPSNKMQGYIVRRLLRRSIMQSDKLSLPEGILSQLVPFIADYFKKTYPEVDTHRHQIQAWTSDEEAKFRQSLKRGKATLSKTLATQTSGNKVPDEQILAKTTFNSLSSHGLPFEVTAELLTRELGNFNQAKVKKLHEKYVQKHAQNSRSEEKGTFKGGLADHSKTITQYHTATHLLHQALREVLGDHVQQMGSNITGKRLRFDFKHPAKLTGNQKATVVSIINQKIAENLPVHKSIETKDQALKSGALAFFRETYPDQVSVYTIGKDPLSNWYSKELCGGPHVSSTGEIPPVTIKKEESVGAGVRRIYITF